MLSGIAEFHQYNVIKGHYHKIAIKTAASQSFGHI